MTKTSSSSFPESARRAALAEYKILDTPPETAFDDLALLASELLSAPIAFVSFVDGERVWHKARVGLAEGASARDQSVCDRAILRDSAVEFSDVLADEDLQPGAVIEGEAPLRFFAGVPLVTPEGFQLGTLCVMDRAPRRLTCQQWEALQALARQVVALLELRRALGNLSRSYQELHLLVEMSRMLQLCSCSEDSYAIIARFGGRLFPEEAGCVFLQSAGSGDLRLVTEWGGAAARPETLPVNDCWALRRGQAHAVTSGAGGPVCAHLGAMAFDFSICVPLAAQGESLGVLSLVARKAAEEGAERRVFLTGSKRELAAATAQSVALALGNLRLRERLESQSVRDPLTGLFNRRYLEESLERELAHAARHQQPLGLIMIDLDNFGAYNNRFGHLAGDELLRLVAELVRSGVRAGDIACRYGGDEIAVILPGASLESTRARAEELCKVIKQLHGLFEQQGIDPITLSTGVAACPDHGTTSRGLLRLTDEALYKAKALGRDQAVVAGRTAAEE